MTGSGPATVIRFIIFIVPLTRSSDRCDLSLTLFGFFGLKTHGGNAGADFGGFGAQVNIVCLLKHHVVSGAVEFHITYLASDCQGKLDGPQTEDGLGAATAHKLGVFVTYVVDELLAQLAG